MNRYTILNVYDFIHMYNMDGRDGLPRREVLDYIRRVSPNAKTDNPISQSKNFERFKNTLKSIGIEYETTVNPGEGAIFKIKDTTKARTLVDRLLEHEVQTDGKKK